MTTALYPGSFDPVTLGHMDIIRRAHRVFGRVVVCVTPNSDKNCRFTPEERAAFIRKATSAFEGVTVDIPTGLFAEYAKQYESAVIVKGIRLPSDFDAEFRIAAVNKRLDKSLDTVLFISEPEHTYLSSTIVREMLRYGASLEGLVPEEIIRDIENVLADCR